MTHSEAHKSHRTGWLRAAVLGANDGIISTASLIIGVASAGASLESILLAGVAGLAAGTMSMAAGEYVSVCSQRDTEKADLELESRSLEQHFDSEQEELAKIYEERGLKPELARQVAVELMAHDALGAHARDDIGLPENSSALPVQAALTSAATFCVGAALPLLITWFAPTLEIIAFVAASSLLFLALLGALAAFVGGASVTIGAIRVAFWGALAMALTAAVGHLFGVAV